MGQPTNGLLQRLGRAQLWPQLSGRFARSRVYGEQQARGVLLGRLLCLILRYTFYLPTTHPWYTPVRRDLVYRRPGEVFTAPGCYPGMWATVKRAKLPKSYWGRGCIAPRYFVNQILYGGRLVLLDGGDDRYRVCRVGGLL